MGENAVEFSIFGKIFQTFRKSYFLVPSHEERKWRRKSGKKTLRKGFWEIAEKTYKKIGISGEKNIVSERSLRDFRICKKFGSQRYIRRNAVF